MNKQNFFLNRRDESIEVLAEKFEKQNKGKTLEEIMQTVRRIR